MMNWFKNTYFYIIFIYRPFIAKSGKKISSFFLYVFLIVCLVFYFVMSENHMPKPLNELSSVYGIAKERNYSLKNSLGIMRVLLDNKKEMKIGIIKDDEDIYKILEGEKVKIFLSPGVSQSFFVAQIQSLNGDIYKAYNYEEQLEKYYNMKKFNNFMLFLIFFTIFMIFLVNKKGEMPPLLKTYKIWGKIF